MADTFQYGTVTLTHVKTESFEQRTEYDPSNTDALWTRTSLTVTGMLAYGLSPAAGGETAADTLKRIEHSLMQPRQYLRYQVGSKTVIEVGDKNTGKAVDANKGPMPQSITTGVITEGSIEVRFSIVTCIITCPSLGNGSARRGFASNRWSQTETYDRTGYCTLQTSGLVICRTDLQQYPDQLRGLVAPPVRQGYQRVNSKYTLSADGTQLQYDCEDKEYYLPPPSMTVQDSITGQTISTQALEADGNMIIVSSTYGARWTGIVTVKLKGPKNISKQDLLARAIGIGQSMIQPFLSKQDPRTRKVVQGAFIDYRIETGIYVNEVSIQVTGLLDYAIVQAALPGGNGPVGLLSQIPVGSETKNQPGISPTIRGNGQFLAMLSAVFQDPCVDLALIRADLTSVTQLVQPDFSGELVGSNVDITQFGSNGGGGLTVPIAQKTGGTNVPNTPQDQRQNPATIAIGPITQDPPAPDIAYDIWSMHLDYEYDTGAVVLPSTKDGQKSSYIRVRNGSLMMVVTWTAQRTGQPPEIPDPCPGTGTDVNSTNYKLIGKLNIGTEELEQGPTGALRYKISGCYRYGVLDPTLVPVVNPLPPFLAKEILGTTATTAAEQVGQIAGQLIQGNIVPATQGVADLAGTLVAGFIGLVVPSVAGAQNGGGNAQINPGRDVGNNGVYHLERSSIWYSLKTISPYKFFASC